MIFIFIFLQTVIVSTASPTTTPGSANLGSSISVKPNPSKADLRLIRAVGRNGPGFLSRQHQSRAIGEKFCPRDYRYYRAFCYRLVTQEKNFEEATAICESDNAKLVGIHASSTNEFVGSLDSDETGLLIGYRYNETTRNYEWSDGYTGSTWTNYGDDFHKHREYYGNCVKTIKEKWMKMQCETEKAKFVCSRDLAVNDGCRDSSEIQFSSGEIVSPGYPDVIHFDDVTRTVGCMHRLAAKNGLAVNLTVLRMEIFGDQGGIDVYRGWDRTRANKVARIDKDFSRGRYLVIDFNRVLLHSVDVQTGAWKIRWGETNSTSVDVPKDRCPDEDRIYTKPATIVVSRFHGEASTGNGCRYKLMAKEGENVVLHFDGKCLDKNITVKIYNGWHYPNLVDSIRPQDNEKLRFVVPGNTAMVHVIVNNDKNCNFSWLSRRSDTAKHFLAHDISAQKLYKQDALAQHTSAQ